MRKKFTYGSVMTLIIYNTIYNFLYICFKKIEKFNYCMMLKIIHNQTQTQTKPKLKPRPRPRWRTFYWNL